MRELEKTSQAMRIRAAVWLRENRQYILLENLDQTPRPGDEFDAFGCRWRVVAWTDRIECELAHID